MDVPDNTTVKEHDKSLWSCRVRGVSCEFGICDECPNTREEQDDKEEE